MEDEADSPLRKDTDGRSTGHGPLPRIVSQRVTAGPHVWILDEPKAAGGGGEGPTPYDMLAAALGGCTSMTLHYFAKRKKIARS